MQSTLTSKGQATIPKEVRDHLRIKPGDAVKFFLSPDGGAYILPVVPLSSLKGSLKGKSKRKSPVSIEEMNEAVQEAAVERYLRSTKK